MKNRYSDESRQFSQLIGKYYIEKANISKYQYVIVLNEQIIEINKMEQSNSKVIHSYTLSYIFIQFIILIHIF